MSFRIWMLTACLASMGLTLGAPAMAAAVESDQVVLNNGDRITGHVLSTSAETVTLATDAAGTISIQRAAISQIIVEHEATGHEAMGREAMGQEAILREAIVRAGVPKGGVQKTTAPPAVDCMSAGKPVPQSWSFMLQGAPNKVVLGTQSQEVFGAGADLYFCEGSQLDTTTITARGSHSRAYKQRSTSIQTDLVDAEIDQQHFLHQPQGMAVFGVASVFTNNSLGMALEKSAGLGLLSPQLRYKALFYDFAADVRYVNQHLDHFSPALNLAGVRLKQQTHAQGSLFGWNEQAWVMPMFNDVHALQAYASVGPSLALKPWLRLGLTEEEKYLGNAPRPNRKNYFSSTLSLTIQGGSGTSR